MTTSFRLLDFDCLLRACVTCNASNVFNFFYKNKQEYYIQFVIKCMQ